MSKDKTISIDDIELDDEELDNEKEEVKETKPKKKTSKSILTKPMKTDEDKKVTDLIKEGKTISEKTDLEYIISENKPYGAAQFTSSGKHAKYKVYIDDIISITISLYYDNLSTLNPSILLRKASVHHLGKRTIDQVDIKVIDELIKENKVPSMKIKYSHIDLDKRLVILSKTDLRPTPKEVDKEYDKAIKDYKAQYGKSPTFDNKQPTDETNDESSEEIDDIDEINEKKIETKSKKSKPVEETEQDLDDDLDDIDLDGVDD